MNRTERALYSQYFRQSMERQGYRLSPDEDGVTWWMRLGDWLQEAAGKTFVVVAVCLYWTIIGALLLGHPLFGFCTGITCAAIALRGFQHRPALGPVGRYIERLSILAGNPPHDALVAQSLNYAVAVSLAVSVYAAMGALVGLMIGAAVPGAVIVVIGVLAYAWRDAADQQPLESDTQQHHGNVNGEAELASGLEQIKEAGLSDGGYGGFFIGTWTAETWHQTKRRFRRIAWQFERIIHHLRFDGETGSVLLFARPGDGKGSCFVLTTLLSNLRDTLFVLDPARQNYNVVKGWLQDCGVTVHRFDPMGPDSPEEPRAQCNPLGDLGINDSATELVIAEDAAIFVPVHHNEHNSFFSGEAQNITAKIALWLLETLGPKASWPMVAELLHLPLHKLNQVFGDMRQSRFPSVRMTGESWFIDIVDGKPRGILTDGLRDVLATARKDMAFLLSSGIYEMFSHSGCSFANGKRRREAYFLCMGDNQSEAMQKCAHVLLATAKRQLCTAGGLTTLWILDELAAALPPEASKLVRELLSLARKFRIRIAGICQSLSQFEDWCGSKEVAQALRGLVGANIFYGASSPADIAEIQRTAGRYTLWMPSTSPLARYGIEGSTGPTGVELLSPEALRDMQRNGEQLIFIADSRRAVICPRTSYIDIPELKARAAPDPYHPEEESLP